MSETFETLTELAFYQARNFENPKAFNFKENGEWRSFSSQEFLQKAFFLACGLREMGLEKGEKVVIYSYQNPIWLMMDFAIILAGGVSVPIFHNISKQNLLYQIEDCGAKFIFVDEGVDFAAKNHFSKIEFLENELPKTVKNVISYDFKVKNSMDFEVLCNLGKRVSSAFIEDELDFSGMEKYLPKPESRDLATIIYTSGSTGNPKGVALCHENLVCQIKDAGKCFDIDFSRDRVLSFLPLAHIFERMVMMFYISRGVEIYFVDDIKKISAFLKEVRPTLMTAVPRVLEKVFAKINEGVSEASFVKKTLAKWALNRALKKEIEAKNLLDRFYDFVIYRKFRAGFGSNLGRIICGGAALSPHLEKFYHNIGVKVFCGYGLSETSPVLAVNCEENYKFATVGKKFDCTQLKIADDGELLARGKNIMLGYYDKPRQTAQVFSNGWFKTGDLARIDDEGFVTITGRKKELFKTASGKYVRPIPIEQKLMQEIEFLLGVVILAEGRSFVSALLFVDFEMIEKAKTKFEFDGGDQEFLASDILREFVGEKIEKINGELDRGEQIFKFAIIDREISIESGHVTPSMKLKRAKIEEDFALLVEG